MYSLKVLAKADLDNTIRIHQLIKIQEISVLSNTNFG